MDSKRSDAQVFSNQLDRIEIGKYFELMQTTNCLSLASAIVELWQTEKPLHKQLVLRELGLVSIVKDFNKLTYYFRLYGENFKLLWEQEIYYPIRYVRLMPQFHYFIGDECIIGLSFACVFEAEDFWLNLGKFLKRRWNFIKIPVNLGSCEDRAHEFKYVKEIKLSNKQLIYHQDSSGIIKSQTLNEIVSNKNESNSKKVDRFLKFSSFKKPRAPVVPPDVYKKYFEKSPEIYENLSENDKLKPPSYPAPQLPTTLSEKVNTVSKDNSTKDLKNQIEEVRSTLQSDSLNENQENVYLTPSIPLSIADIIISPSRDCLLKDIRNTGQNILKKSEGTTDAPSIQNAPNKINEDTVQNVSTIEKQFIPQKLSQHPPPPPPFAIASSPPPPPPISISEIVISPSRNNLLDEIRNHKGSKDLKRIDKDSERIQPSKPVLLPPRIPKHELQKTNHPENLDQSHLSTMKPSPPVTPSIQTRPAIPPPPPPPLANLPPPPMSISEIVITPSRGNLLDEIRNHRGSKVLKKGNNDYERTQPPTPPPRKIEDLQTKLSYPNHLTTFKPLPQPSKESIESGKAKSNGAVKSSSSIRAQLNTTMQRKK